MGLPAVNFRLRTSKSDILSTLRELDAHLFAYFLKDLGHRLIFAVSSESRMVSMASSWLARRKSPWCSNSFRPGSS